MKKLILLAFGCVAVSAFAEPRVNMASSPAANNFGFSQLPRPSNNDDATGITMTLVDGTRDGNGAQLDVLTDGRIPKSDDDPRSCFFFVPNTDGGRIMLDLGSARRIAQINTYSWHNSERSPQVYEVYGSDGQGARFDPAPKRPQNPAEVGWRPIAKVDTRTKEMVNGQQIVSVTDTRGELGNFRYLLFDIHRTAPGGKTPFDNTFYCEIDVLSKQSPKPTYDESVMREQRLRELDVPKQSMRFVADFTAAPQLEKWVTNDLFKVCEAWYPKLRTMLASEGHTPASRVTFRIRTDMDGPASAGGGTINVNAQWTEKVPKEAIGAMVHEMVHIVQAYSKGNTPGWLVEGIADYIRWFLFEPESRGAEITSRNIGNARYDGNYRISANFLDYVFRTYDKSKDGKLLLLLNATLREGKYTEEFWKTNTGKTLAELNDDWLADCRRRIEAK